MRIILIIPVILLVLCTKLDGQIDFKALDSRTYDYYLKGDYINLKKAADTMLLQGIDYYYLRERLGITEYYKQFYSSAVKDFSRAIEFNSLDTMSREYIYYSYLFSGRKSDAILYLRSIPDDKKNTSLRKEDVPSSSEFFFGLLPHCL